MCEVKRFSEMIDAAGSICLVTHTHPDGDAIGSTGAMFHYLRGCRGKTAALLLPDALPPTLAFAAPDTPVVDAYLHPSEAAQALAAADLVICLDFPQAKRTATLEQPLRAAGGRKVLLDHHLNPERELFDLVFSETEISSASELVFRVLMQMPDIAGDVRKLPLDAANSLTVGMTTDTNNFNNSVFPSTLRMASALLDRGVDRDAIVQHIQNEYRENRVRAFGYLQYEKMRVLPCGAAYIVIDAGTKRRFDLRDGETEGLVNVPLTIGAVKMSLLLTQDDKYFRVSVRSKKGTSANALATGFFHGGGHENASGGKLYFPGDIASPEDASAYVEQALEKFFYDKK